MLQRALLICVLMSFRTAFAEEGGKPATTQAATTKSVFDFQTDEVRQLQEQVAALKRELAASKAKNGATTRPVEPEGSFTLKVAADVDGSDEVHITREGLSWKHKEWEWPLDVNVNGREWDPHADLTWDALGVEVTDDAWAAMKPKLIAREGRDTVAMEIAPDGVIVYFADSPGGSDTYSAKIEFKGLRPRQK